MGWHPILIPFKDNLTIINAHSSAAAASARAVEESVAASLPSQQLARARTVVVNVTWIVIVILIGVVVDIGMVTVIVIGIGIVTVIVVSSI